MAHLGQVQKLIAANVGASLVLVQIWASDEATLGEWLPVAEAFVASMQVTEAERGTTR